MKLKELKPVLYSVHGDIQSAIVYDGMKAEEIENGCSVDYAVKTYADRDVRRIQAENSMIVIIKLFV